MKKLCLALSAFAHGTIAQANPLQSSAEPAVDRPEVDNAVDHGFMVPATSVMLIAGFGLAGFAARSPRAALSV